MPDTLHTNYSIRREDGRTIIVRKLSQRDFWYIVYYMILGPALVFISIHYFPQLKFSWSLGTFIGIFFFGFLFFWGITRLIIGVELISNPTGSAIIVDKNEKTLKAKLIFFRRFSAPFENLKEIQLTGHDTITYTHIKGKTHKRRLYYHQLQVLMTDDTKKPIHRFLYNRLMIPKASSETLEVSADAKQIAKLIASEMGIKYRWMGTKREDE